MSEPGNEPVQRNKRWSVYTLTECDVNGLREFVDGLYGVGAIGDERVSLRSYEIAVQVASDDLLPRPGQGRVTMRHREYRRLRATITGLKVATALLAIFCIALAIWLVLPE